MRYLFFLFVLFLLASCGETTESTTTETTTTTPESTTTTTAQQPQGTLYPSVTTEIMTKLWEECDYIDYSFTSDKIPFSMSLNEKSSIQQTLGLISTTPAYVREDCESIGRMYLQKEGVNIMEIDVYFFGEGCQYWVFLENNEATYANYLTPDGVAYYQRFFNQTNVNQ